VASALRSKVLCSAVELSISPKSIWFSGCSSSRAPLTRAVELSSKQEAEEHCETKHAADEIALLLDFKRSLTNFLFYGNFFRNTCGPETSKWNTKRRDFVESGHALG